MKKEAMGIVLTQPRPKGYPVLHVTRFSRLGRTKEAAIVTTTEAATGIFYGPALLLPDENDMNRADYVDWLHRVAKQAHEMTTHARYDRSSVVIASGVTGAKYDLHNKGLLWTPAGTEQIEGPRVVACDWLASLAVGEAVRPMSGSMRRSIVVSVKRTDTSSVVSHYGPIGLLHVRELEHEVDEAAYRQAAHDFGASLGIKRPHIERVELSAGAEELPSGLPIHKAAMMGAAALAHSLATGHLEIG